MQYGGLARDVCLRALCADDRASRYRGTTLRLNTTLLPYLYYTTDTQLSSPFCTSTGNKPCSSCAYMEARRLLLRVGG